MIDKVRKILGLPSRKTGNKIVLSVEKLERRVALLENGQLEEYSVERSTSRNIVGSVYKGKVKNIEMGLKAMFVDIGFEKNAFLHFWDAIPAALDSGIEEIDRPSKKQGKRITAKDIPGIYPVGSEVIVQVTKGPIGTKGPRVTTNLSFAGRYLVLMPFSDRSGISRKIEEPKERDRLRKILRQLDIPEGIGVIIRTVGEGQRARYFVRDLRFLLDQWAKVEQQIRESPAPCRVFEEPDLVERTVRDFLTEEIDEVVCDDRAATDRMSEMVGQISRRARNQIHFYDGATPIFETYGVQKQIDDAFHRHEEPQRPADGLQPDERATEARQGQDARAAHFLSRFDGNDAAARSGKSKRHHLPKLSLLRRARRGENFDDHERGTAPHPQYGDAEISGHDPRNPRHFKSRRAEAIERGRRGIAGGVGATLRGAACVPGRLYLSSRKIRYH